MNFQGIVVVFEQNLELKKHHHLTFIEIEAAQPGILSGDLEGPEKHL